MLKETPRSRIQSIDLLRGLVMVIMALDHCRDFLHIGNFNGQDPLDFATTTPWLFMTRWVTHFCAPVFVFLAGTSIAFMAGRKTKSQLSLFLLTRGLWLIFMELTLVNWGWAGNLDYTFVAFQVIWALGISMVIISALLYLPQPVMIGLGLLLVLGHNLLDPFDYLAKEEPYGIWWAILHTPHIYNVTKTFTFAAFYPFLPWLGLMILGIGLGNLYRPGLPVSDRRRYLMLLGGGCILVFCLLRWGNFYGDSFHWEHQAKPLFTALSFVNTTKYPPSLLYILMTIGPALIFLSLFEPVKNGLTRVIVVFGRVPLFYYLLHLYLFHAMAFAWFFISGHSAAELSGGENLGGFPDGFGMPLGGVYLAWLTGIFILYFPCRWYDRYKSNHPGKWWLSYL